MGTFDLSTLENGAVFDAWNMLRIRVQESATSARMPGATISVWFNPMFSETGFVGNFSDAHRTPTPLQPRLIVHDDSPISSTGTGVRIKLRTPILVVPTFALQGCQKGLPYRRCLRVGCKGVYGVAEQGRCTYKVACRRTFCALSSDLDVMIQPSPLFDPKDLRHTHGPLVLLLQILQHMMWLLFFLGYATCQCWYRTMPKRDSV